LLEYRQTDSQHDAMSLRVGPVSSALALLGVVVAYLYQDAVRNGVKVTVQRTMACSTGRAFQAVADFEVMPQISSDILGYDFVDDPPMHWNMRFSERRKMKGSVLVTHLQVTEFTPPVHARMVADTHGTIWDTTFDVTPGEKKQEEVVLTIQMQARAHEIFPKLLNPIMQVLFRYGLNSHMDHVKVWCEKKIE
jgi:hypothetical protein